ncbi:MAG: carboxypeptidase-like regulatory domain-containing protein [Holophaga sp.]|jgi:hypothetical protein
MFPSHPRLWLYALTLGLALAGLGCGSGAPTVPLPGPQPLPPIDPATAGNLSVHLVQDGPPGDLVHLNLVIAELEVRSGGYWRPVYQPKVPVAVDILAGNDQTPPKPIDLADQVLWPPDPNDALRFTFAPGSTAERQSDFDPLPLATPAQVVYPMGLPGSFSVATGGASDLRITFSVDHVVQQDPLDFDRYLFLPGLVRGYDLAATGYITGTVENEAGEVMPGTVVTAQLLVPGGTASTAGAFRTVQSDQDGRFTLDLLPKGSTCTWTAVSQVVSGPPSFPGTAGQVSGTLGNSPYDHFDCPIMLEEVQSNGLVHGTVTPPPGTGQAERVDLVQAVQNDPLGFCPLVVTSAPVAADGTFTFEVSGGYPPVGPPVGIYSAVLHRFALDAGLDLVDQPVASEPIVVQSGVELNLPF